MHKGSRARGVRKHTHSNDHGKNLRKKSVREDELLEIIKAGDEALILILDQVQDPHNLGACLRTADGVGCRAVIAPKDRSAPLNETVRRIACGAAETTPYIQVTNLSRTIQLLKDEGFWLVGTSDNANQSLYEIDLKGKIGIVMGAEGKGLRRLTEEKCDFIAKLPMMGSVECLNVSVATGVCLYEAIRQRNLL